MPGGGDRGEKKGGKRKEQVRQTGGFVSDTEKS
jgi:hypothetical protein